MRWLAGVVAAAGLLGVAMLGSAAPPGEVTDPGERLDLSIRARGLGLGPLPSATTNLGLESVKAPTGAGSLKMPPPTSEVAPGVYLSVAPACLPGEDPLAPRRITPSRRR